MPDQPSWEAPSPPEDFHDAATGEREQLPVELGPIDTRVRDDSARWLSTLPSARRVMEYAASLSEPTVAAARHAPSHEDTDNTAPRTRQPQPLPARARRFPVPLAPIAAILVVALMAGLFVSLMRSRSPVVTAPPGAWVRDTHLTKQSSIPVLAPSNPSVVYETAGQTIRRSDDGGATWRAFPIPPMPGPSLDQTIAAYLLVSQSDPNLVVLETMANLTTPDTASCPPGTSRLAPPPNFGSSTCVADVVSVDGGAHWTPVSLPMAGGLISVNAASGGVLQAQGGQLYAGLAYPQQPSRVGQALLEGVRLVTSRDGIHWSLVDTALAARVGLVTQFAIAPTGRSIYALAVPPSAITPASPTAPPSASPTPTPLPQAIPPTTYEIWRSTDGGGHWQRMSTVAGAEVWLLGAAPQASDGVSPALYRQVMQPVGTFHYAVSLDGGQTWIAVPMAGVPSTYAFSSMATATANGGIVAVYWDETPTFTTPTGQPPTAYATDFHPARVYSWLPGAGAWNQISEPLAAIALKDVLVAPDANGQTRLWLVAQDSGPAPNIDAGYTVYSIPLR